MDRIPILKLGSALLVTIQVDMHDRLATALEVDAYAPRGLNLKTAPRRGDPAFSAQVLT